MPNRKPSIVYPIDAPRRSKRLLLPKPSTDEVPSSSSSVVEVAKKVKRKRGGGGEISNDGATAKILVEPSKAQPSVAGDVTTTVVISSALLQKCLLLLSDGIHPTVISDSLHKASVKALDILTAMAVPVELSDRDSLMKSVSTSMVSQYSSLIAPIAVDSVLSVIDPSRPEMVDLRDVKIVKKLGGTVDDTELVNKGLVFDMKVSHAAGGPTRMENAKIAVIQFQISPPKNTDIQQSNVVSDYSQMGIF
jgi:T-complex protein 1 subunit delta